jgi:hypothetical protein
MAFLSVKTRIQPSMEMAKFDFLVFSRAVYVYEVYILYVGNLTE